MSIRMSTPSIPVNEEAQQAFIKKDVEMSKMAHDAKRAASVEEPHKINSGKYIKPLVFGGLDGCITTFAIVAGVAGADMSAEVVLVLGLANLVADGISMGFGEYLSAKAETEYTVSEREREAWEMENYPEGEKEEMVEIYQKHGYSEDDAKTVVNILSKNKEWFVDHMMVEELGMMPPDEDEEPAKSGAVTFLSFLAFGFVPLIAFLSVSSTSAAFFVAIVLTVLTLAVLGGVKAHLASRPVLPSVAGVVMNGSMAAAAAYLISWGLGHAYDIHGC